MEMVIDPVVTNLDAMPLTHSAVSETSLGWSMTPRGRSMQYWSSNKRDWMTVAQTKNRNSATDLHSDGKRT